MDGPAPPKGGIILVPKKDLEAHSFQQCATAALLLVYSRVYYYTKRGGQC